VARSGPAEACPLKAASGQMPPGSLRGRSGSAMARRVPRRRAPAATRRPRSAAGCPTCQGIETCVRLAPRTQHWQVM
jgi:hypothetical protein